MNKLLKLRGQFQQKTRGGGFGPPKLRSGDSVSIEKILKIKNDLEKCKKYWEDKDLINDAIISIKYVGIIPKSRRMEKLLKGSKIIGAKFVLDEIQKHVITYYIKKDEIGNTIKKLDSICNILREKIGEKIDNSDFEKIEQKIDFAKLEYTKDNFLKSIVDLSNIEKIYVDIEKPNIQERSIVSIYETEKSAKELLKKIGIELADEYIRNTTLLIDASDYEILKTKAPYMIAMEVVDINDIPAEVIYSESENYGRTIDDPTNEPVIGVIDTPFDDKVYFSKWVESQNFVKDVANEEDYKHGTSVSSIIVDGPSLNPFMDDECGRFRVKHFGVALNGKYSSFDIVKNIEKIVKDNPEIKVWNLSLGSDKEIESNFISPEGSILDEIQTENDVIFVIAATNIPIGVTKKHMKIGAPADSINSLIVNSVNIDGNIASYAREGNVLSFYVKPDVCYFGGDIGFGLNVCDGLNTEHLAGGTSYAAPWISRKLGYLIYVLGFTREEAKAILIDSCEKWNEKYNENEKNAYGHGIVPTKISEIVNSQNDEIKFVISGISQKYDTYNYKLPIPMSNGRYPFAAKATMCYMPKCSRNQGVDYTNTEFELKIGRLKEKNSDNTYKILSINNDLQDEEGEYTTEEKARKEYRKWDNTKCIKEKYSSRSRDKISYENPLWGISVTTKNRENPNDGKNIRFGIIVTLKELHGVNRINEFVQMCSFNQWFVEEIDIDNQLELYNKADNDIEFDE